MNRASSLFDFFFAILRVREIVAIESNRVPRPLPPPRFAARVESNEASNPCAVHPRAGDEERAERLRTILTRFAAVRHPGAPYFAGWSRIATETKQPPCPPIRGTRRRVRRPALRRSIHGTWYRYTRAGCVSSRPTIRGIITEWTAVSAAAHYRRFQPSVGRRGSSGATTPENESNRGPPRFPPPPPPPPPGGKARAAAKHDAK